MSKEFWIGTTSQIKDFREKTILEQEGLDPILLQPLRKPCLDHDHWGRGEARGVLEQCVNTWEGYVVKYWMKFVQHNTDRSLSFALRTLADYLERDFSHNPLHLSFISDMRKHLERCNKATIVKKAKDDLNIELIEEEMTQEELIVSYLEAFIIKCEEN